MCVYVCVFVYVCACVCACMRADVKVGLWILVRLFAVPKETI